MFSVWEDKKVLITGCDPEGIYRRVAWRALGGMRGWDWVPGGTPARTQPLAVQVGSSALRRAQGRSGHCRDRGWGDVPGRP